MTRSGSSTASTAASASRPSKTSKTPLPLFDLRIAEQHRGHGHGLAALTAITAHVFETMPKVTRFEGQTREDNITCLVIAALAVASTFRTATRHTGQAATRFE
ncbi:MAG: hypothetical protein QM607_07705 [Microbacterium sp.]